MFMQYYRTLFLQNFSRFTKVTNSCQLEIYNLMLLKYRADMALECVSIRVIRTSSEIGMGSATVKV